MELQSPYLEAIQAIPGVTPGQKFKELNSIARRIAQGTKASGDSTAVGASEVPEALMPLVRVEIANVLRQPDGIVEALKSEDSEVVDRALRMNWFFRGDNKNVLSVDYLDTRILPYASLKTRTKLIKRLGVNLRTSGETKLAEDFYTYFAGKYGRIQAETLFIACSENFVWETITKNKIILSCRAVKNLFVRYPELVIRYLKRSKINDDGLHEDGHKVRLSLYADFLPRLIKKHQNAFIEILEINENGYGIKLSNKSTETFLKNNIEALLNNPTLYTSIMPIKVITAKLTKAQFRVMFEKLFPEKLQEFRYSNLETYLEYYPEQEKLALIVDSYRSVYNANLLDNHEAITPELLCMLPAEERVRQARIKLEKPVDPDERPYDVKKVWRCYLPVDETIPLIKEEIAKASAGTDRQSQLEQMLYTCKVNNDKDALVEVLRYFTTRHKNEQMYLINEILEKLAEFFDLYTLGKEHWTIINDFIKFLDVKDKFTENGYTARPILAPSIYYDLVHDLPIDDKIFMLIKMNITGWNVSWSTMEKYPEYEKRCYEAILSMIPVKFPQTDKIWNQRRGSTIRELIQSMYDFNARNAKANNKIEKLLLKNYPWLCDAVKDIIKKADPYESDWIVQDIIHMLKVNEPELYKEWIPIEEAGALDMETFAALARLRDDPQNILDHWEAYLDKAKSDATRSYAQRFMKVTRWHQSIPIKFAERCLKDITERTADCDNSIVILGALLEGSEFAQIIEPLVPKGSTIEIVDENSKKDYRLVSAIPRAMNIANPPVPLRLVLTFCEGEYLNLGLISLANACRRTSLVKIKPFTETLVDRRVSVKKHGIRLFCLVSSIDDTKVFLMEHWKTETHRSIRAVLFARMYDLFIREPTPSVWTFMKECIDDLKNDDDDIVNSLLTMNDIPDEYFADFTKKLLEKFAKLKDNGYNEKRIVEHINRVISGIDDVKLNLLPEDFARYLLRTYFGNPLLDHTIRDSTMTFALYHYLRPEKSGFESRLSFLCSLYEDNVKQHWNVSDPKRPKFHPINYLSHNFISHLTTGWSIQLDESRITNRNKVIKAILETYLAVLKPEEDYVSYVLLTLSVALDEIREPKEMAKKIIETLPHLVEALSPQMVVKLASPVKDLIECRIDKSERTNVMYTFIETLCQSGDVNSCIIAASLLFFGEKAIFDDRHNKIVESLLQIKHPAVRSIVYHHRNTTSISD